MKTLILIFVMIHIGTFARGDSDFFNSAGSVPAEMFAGQKPKPETAPAAAPVVATPVTPATVPGTPAKAQKKVDMPREVFVEWVGGEDDDRAPSSADEATQDAKTKRAAPNAKALEPKNIDEILERELRKSGSKKDSPDEEENRFIEVN